MLKLSVEVKENPKFEEEFVDKIKRVLLKTMLKMEELAIKNAPVDQGELRQKINLKPIGLSSWYELRSDAKHSEAMEYGTRPFYAPIDPLKEWARRKLGNESIGYAVRAKIAKYGITAQPFMRPAKETAFNYWFPLYKKEEFS